MLIFTEEIVSAVIMAIGDTEGEPIGLRAATILAAIRDKVQPGGPEMTGFVRQQDKTIGQRLKDAGYTHRRDPESKANRHLIINRMGEVVERCNAEEACAFLYGVET